MINYEQYIITKGGCELGILWEDIKEKILAPEDYKKFVEWMGGQTCACLDMNCKITLVFTRDVERFLRQEAKVLKLDK